jgi:hypothetical protein
MGGKFKGYWTSTRIAGAAVGHPDKPFPAEFAWNAGFGIYHGLSGFHVVFCIFRKKFPVLGSF